MIRLKRLIINIAVISLAFILFIIWHRSFIENSIQTVSPNLKFYKVYLITTDKGFQYWGILNQGAADMAALTGIQYIWDAPSVRNTDQQIEIINRAVEHGANALLIAADDPKRISGAVEDAKAKGVKVFYVDSPAYEEAITTLSTDNYKAGVLAAQTMISLLDDRGINSGEIGIVNLADKENTRLREVGFRDTMAKDTRFQVLDTVYTLSDSPDITKSAAEGIISENENLVALLGTSEGTTIGVGSANKENDNKYVSIGFDKTEANIKLLNSGSLMAIIDQNPYTMGYLGMAEAIAAILGKNTGPEYIDTGVSVVFKR
jgi:ribose transport system substrate-binding protein